MVSTIYIYICCNGTAHVPLPGFPSCPQSTATAALHTLELGPVTNSSALRRVTDCSERSPITALPTEHFTGALITTNSPAHGLATDFWPKPKLYYDRRSVGQSVLVSGTHLGPGTNYCPTLFNCFLDSCGFVGVGCPL
jgi:hypothetical protein